MKTTASALTTLCVMALSFSAPAPSLAAPFTVRDFFAGLDAEFIAVEDELSPEEKEEILRSGPERNDSVCPADGAASGAWYVLERNETPTSMELRTCSGSSAVLRIYGRTSGGFIGAVISIMGNHGQTQTFRFFEVSRAGQVGKEVSKESLGFQAVHRNELLTKAQRFPADENSTVPLFDVGNGAFEAQPWTFADPSWSGRHIRRVRFVWDGRQFRKRVIR